MRNFILSLALVLMGFVSIFQATSAVFEESVKVAGTSFSVGAPPGDVEVPIDTNTALKMMGDLSGQPVSGNLFDSVSGMEFGYIHSEWTDEMAIKIHNQGDINLDLISKADYVNDPRPLRDRIYVEVLAWNDTNGNGLVDVGEVGASYGRDTILRWRNDTFPLGEIQPDETRGFVLKFDGSGITPAVEGATAVYDFVFTGIEVE